jgi:MFS family permease
MIFAISDFFKKLELSKEDDAHPRAWPKWKKFANIFIVASMASKSAVPKPELSTHMLLVLSPLASSIFAPGIKQIAEALNTTETGIIGCQTGFVIMLGVGPLVLAPLSETFGRKIVYLVCFGIFTILQIPAALSKSLPVLILWRSLAGFFGSMLCDSFTLGVWLTCYPGVSVANGGGTISDMYEPSERAGIFGWYLLGPLLGPGSMYYLAVDFTTFQELNS